MGLRLITSPHLTNVVPLRSAWKAHETANELPREPQQLDDAVIVALLVHRSTAGTRCENCRREGF